MLEIRLNVNEKGELLCSEGVSLEAPKASVTTSLDKVGKTRSSSKIKFDSAVIPLGEANIPEGVVLNILPSEELYKKYKLLPTWKGNFMGKTSIYLPVVALGDTAISKGEPVAKFCLSLDDNTPVSTKLQLFFGKYRFVKDKEDEPQAASDKD